MLPEVWLRGPLPDVPPLLQPVAHALLQAREEVSTIMNGFPEARIWDRPAGVASVAFHLQHLSGVLNRLFTYARGKSLNEDQARALAAEGREDAGVNMEGLLAAFHTQVDHALIQLKETNEAELTHPRAVGRAQLPSTVFGLLFHAAEHTQRHVGQLLVTARVLL